MEIKNYFNQNNKIIFIFIFILISICFLYLIEKNSFDNEDSICKSLYINNNVYNIDFIPELFTQDFCKEIIVESEQFANKNGWKKTRHNHYPTTDNIITPEWKVFSPIISKLKKYVNPKINQMFGVETNKLFLSEVFIVKYNVNDQKSLDFHADGSEFSFVICLNDDFTGGGTTFLHSDSDKNPGSNHKLNIGDCIVFSGQNTHKGEEITSGTRYILTGFINYKIKDHCKDLVSNYVWKKRIIMCTNFLLLLFVIFYI